MYPVGEIPIKDALYVFRNIVPSRDNNYGGRFFEIFSSGNTPKDIHMPYERFRDYEQLLRRLQEEDQEKYSEMHKGTPFYFLGWLGFDMGNYDRGLFYMDAALSEDIRNSRRKGRPNEWKKQPAYIAIRLASGSSQPQVAQRVIKKIKLNLQGQLDRFNNEVTTSSESEEQITIEAFVNMFVSELVEKEFNEREEDGTRSPYRSLVTAFYAFLLEFKDRQTDLALRSDEGGSVEPFIVHLFRGGLLFESLLKHFYPHNNTLGNIFKDKAFQEDFDKGLERQTYADSLEVILNGATDGYRVTSFATTAKLRNISGHNLVWDDVFDDPINYCRLVSQEINALFYIIQRKFLSP